MGAGLTFMTGKTEVAMAEETIFSKIIRREVPADIVYQDDRVTAFRDIAPRAPTHILIVPNRQIATLNEVSETDEALLGHMMVVASQLAREQGIAEQGYRVVMNCNQHGGQEVWHIHLHLLGGRQLHAMG